MFVLKKLKVEEGKQSAVQEGHTMNSPRLVIFLYGEHDPVEIYSIHNIKVGWQIGLSFGGNYLQTSPVAEILESSSPNSVRFRTQTSIYELSE